MDVREKLVELIFKCAPKNIKLEWRGEKIEVAISQGNIADYLIDNGVTVQKHGRWLLDGRCSECLENPLTTHKTYCPSCGAKMDLER